MTKTKSVPYYKYDPADPMAVALEKARKLGFVRVIRHEDGEPVYAITKKGGQYVDTMGAP